MSARLLHFNLVLALVAGSLSSLSAQGNASTSPFLPATSAGGGATTVEAPGCELVGVISTSKQILVGINETTVHRSLWIPVGKSVDGIEVLSCDPSHDRAVVRIGGETRTLVMHAEPATLSVSSAKAGNNFVNSSLPPVAVQPLPVAAPVSEQAQKENEARMLVSDLMEIGMQQRKAYEEAQRNAAAQKKSPPPQPR